MLIHQFFELYIDNRSKILPPKRVKITFGLTGCYSDFDASCFDIWETGANGYFRADIKSTPERSLSAFKGKIYVFKGGGSTLIFLEILIPS